MLSCRWKRLYLAQSFPQREEQGKWMCVFPGGSHTWVVEMTRKAKRELSGTGSGEDQLHLLNLENILARTIQ